jgi:spermidine synthase
VGNPASRSYPLEQFARRPPSFFIAAYGGLELVMGLSGLLLTLALFRGQGALLELLAGMASDSLAATLASHFALSFSLMLLPTTCMGATLPVLCMGLERDRDTPSLYSFNTFGAATGVRRACSALVDASLRRAAAAADRAAGGSARDLFSLERLKGGYLSVRNNATELVLHYGRLQTQYVQESQAHFPLLVAPRFRTVAVIGSGYGITAGTFGQYPVERVDAVEILPLFVKHVNYFQGGSHDYLRNPRARVHIADGRHFLVMARDPCDIISINVSDPYLPGSSSLFSTEFYRMVKQKLRPGGIVCQHIFGPDAVSLYHAFKAHFEYVRAVPAYGNGVSLLGSDAPIELRNLHLLEDITLPAMPQEREISPAEYVRRLLAAGDRLVASLDGRPPVFINSDVFPHLEFRRSERVDLFFSNE